jgi:hypothetical protein
MVVSQNPTKPFATLDLTGSGSNFITGRNDGVVQRLVIAFLVVIGEIVAHCSTERGLAEEDHSRKAFRLDAQMKSLKMGVQVRTLRWQAYGIHTGIVQNRSEDAAEVGITIHQHVLLVFQKAVKWIGKIPSNLFHEVVSKCRCASGQVNSASGHVHDEQQIVGDQTTLSPDFDGREVDCSQNVPMGFEEGLPGRLPFPLRHWFDAMLLEDVAHGLVGDLVTQIGPRHLGSDRIPKLDSREQNVELDRR